MAFGALADRIVETDVLVVGGGIAGCPAAAKAAEHGLKVTLVDKACVERSGSSGAGIDHYAGAYPRGMTPKEFAEINKTLPPHAYYGMAQFADPTRLYRLYANGMWGVEELEKLGVTMRWDDGELRPAAFMFGNPFMRVHWTNVKPEMAKGIRKRGVNVIENTMLVDLLTRKGAVVGATGVNIRTGQFIVFKAKAVVLATAACSRIYHPDQPDSWKYRFRYHWCPSSVSGDGWAMAYRAGVELANMEQAGRGYRSRDDLTISWGNTGNEGIESKKLTWDGQEFVDTPLELLESQGKAPLYVGLDTLPDDFQKRIEVAYVDERILSFKIAEERGFNPRSHWYELIDNRPNQLHVPPGINADSDFKTNIKGIYAIGDCVSGQHDVANAAVSGFMVGDTVGEYIKKAADPVPDQAQIEQQKEIALRPLTVKDGTEPMELESSLRYLCTRYIGVNKAEGKLREGQNRLNSLKREFLPKIMASNPHYLMRGLEARNLVDVASVHIQASLERKETWAMHIRLDYPQTINAGKLAYSKLVDGKPVFEIRAVDPLKFPDNHKEER